jgi:putative endonuclease
MATPRHGKFYYLYVLLSLKDNKFYIGSTSDLQSRVYLHLKGQVPATKHRLPVKLIFYEAYLDKYDAIRREDYLKSSKGKQTLRNMLKEYLSKRGQNAKEKA